MKIFNYAEIFNEFTILTCGYCMIIYTDFTTDANLKYSMGWFIIAVVMFNILVNMVVMIIFGIGKVKELCIKLR